METIAVRIDPRLLDNPDVDLRYALPNLLAERTSGAVSDDGYEYVGELPLLVLFLKTSNVQTAISCTLDVVQNVQILGNDLRAATVIAIQREDGFEIIYPKEFKEPFLPE